MKLTNKTPSLKATVKAVQATVTTVNDNDKLALSSTVELFGSAYNMQRKSAELIDEACAKFIATMILLNPNWTMYQAYKKHVLESFSQAKGNTFQSVEKWFNTALNTYLSDADAGWAIPKSKADGAVKMSAVREQQAQLVETVKAIPANELAMQISSLSVSDDVDDVKKAQALIKAKAQANIQEAKAQAKEIKSEASALKTALKGWISELSNTELACLMVLKNNPAKLLALLD